MLLNINSKIRQIRTKFKLDKRGVTAVEYAIIAVAMSAILLTVFANGGIGNALGTAMESVSSSLSSAANASAGSSTTAPETAPETAPGG
ncbi:pilus assembly protein Flp/PilA [Vibrio crassostreae]|uniref:Flp family type IVb pilin n=1 Tax=Vibrio splendidus TaxID=29497 RepID=UPI0024687FDF|nr:Flp family type IVb pilin [Vibrio splendidus]CAK2824072.1 pilus assembly protein Flp/PilA [Vibrio crassostreae]MDH5939487.1 Flp family type IVb pilin [Vibrio splendidus]CAK2824539.1 pilus assembly protein Flp/PilA [Vibrio crassostreae]CAK2829001.1 pilus assembly protein Flp/PilA [Vibrio crassostreae]CAK2830556.1 pilus assembly protein Flp/PilA [Vibrio crassostreae]